MWGSSFAPNAKCRTDYKQRDSHNIMYFGTDLSSKSGFLDNRQYVSCLIAGAAKVRPQGAGVRTLTVMRGNGKFVVGGNWK